MLVQYLRDKKGRRTGVVVGIFLSLSNEISVGWSKCNMKLDKFDKGLGIRIAVGRAEKGSETPCPDSMQELMNNMYYRASRYFKKNHEKTQVQ